MIQRTGKFFDDFSLDTKVDSFTPDLGFASGELQISSPAGKRLRVAARRFADAWRLTLLDEIPNSPFILLALFAKAGEALTSFDSTEGMPA